MLTLIKSIAKRTPLRALVAGWRQRRSVHHFWRWSIEDQTRFDFYRQFVTAGDLVFDVGANMGNRAKIFTRLGATVVAIEPQTACADFLASAYRNKKNFHLVRKALGEAVGSAEMLISDAHVISSLSPSWIRAVKESGRFASSQWSRTQTVQIDTLDNLIAQYGVPAFIKIDVEGFEPQVLSGLTRPVNALSLEFTPECLNNTIQCIDQLCSLGDVVFQISFGETMQLSLPHWVSPHEIRKVLADAPIASFGDVYARYVNGTSCGRGS